MRDANFLKRIGAFMIDYLIIFGYILVTAGIGVTIWLVLFGGRLTLSELEQNSIGFFVMVLPVTLYFICSEISKYSGTIGKRKCKIMVVSNDYHKATVSQIIIRNSIKFIPWQCAHMMIYRGMALNWESSPMLFFLMFCAFFLPVFYIGSMLIRKDGRSIYDLLARTRVVEIGMKTE